MKKSLSLLSVAILLVGTSGCGCCKGLFNKSAAPAAYSQCGPSCGPSCSAGPSCSSGGSCGCGSGTPVTYGFDGGVGAGIPAGASYQSAPMTFPTGGVTYGQ